jgi:hypothetical protein
MHLDQRAWLGIERGQRSDFKSGQDFSVVFDMTNTGKTPALHVKNRVSMKSLETGQKFSPTYGNPRSYTESNSVVQLQQRLMLSTLAVNVSAGQYDDIQNGRGILYACGDIAYDEICRQHSLSAT